MNFELLTKLETTHDCYSEMLNLGLRDLCSLYIHNLVFSSRLVWITTRFAYVSFVSLNYYLFLIGTWRIVSWTCILQPARRGLRPFHRPRDRVLPDKVTLSALWALVSHPVSDLRFREPAVQDWLAVLDLGPRKDETPSFPHSLPPKLPHFTCPPMILSRAQIARARPGRCHRERRRRGLCGRRPPGLSSSSVRPAVKWWSEIVMA